MMGRNSSQVAVIFLTLFGHVVTFCSDCETASCSNIHACYNCNTYLNSDCMDTYTVANEDTCRSELASSSHITAEYIQSTGQCTMARSTCWMWYSSTIDVLFFKTCNTGCSNYTLEKQDNTAVASSAGSYVFYNDVDDHYSCLSKCLPPSQDCTVSYYPDEDDCYVFTTNCGGTCATVSSSDWMVYTVTCNAACPALSAPTNGDVNPSTGFTSGDQATYSCNQGYALFGSNLTTCGSDGNWENSAPTCVPVDCGTLSNPSDGTVTYSSSTFGSEAIYDCNSGYTMSGSSSTNCGSDGNWDNSAPTCVPVDCGILSNPSDGTVTYSSSTFGSQAVYDCNSGYTMSGSSTINCGSDGNWDSSTPTCVPVDCGALSNPSDGTVTFSSTNFGSQAVYDCKSGYTMSGSSLTTCGSGGNWDSSAPTCVPVNCGALSNPSNGTVTYSSTIFGSQAIYDCNTGYTVSDRSSTTCGSDGNWNSSAPTCVPVICGALSNPSYGTVTYSSTTFGSQAIYDCNTGYTMSGSSSSTCGADGNWNSSAPTCIPIDCGALADPSNGSVAFSDTLYSAKANYTCNPGYSLVGSSSRTCHSNGTWVSAEPNCVSIDCGPLVNPVNGTVQTTGGTKFGSTATFTCGAGFVLSHTAPRICQGNSLWSNTSPTCIIPGAVTTPAPEPQILYIMPCICYKNKTFVNLTQEEIIQRLITETQIDTKGTTLALSKLQSRSDSRTSSKMIGLVAIIVLSVIGGLILCCDLITIRASIERLSV